MSGCGTSSPSSDLSATSQKKLEAKLATIKDLLLYKDEGFKRVQAAVELGHQVLRHTAASGHGEVSRQLQQLQDGWGNVASRMAKTKSALDEAIQRWAGFLEVIQRLKRTVDQTAAGGGPVPDDDGGEARPAGPAQVA